MTPEFTPGNVQQMPDEQDEEEEVLEVARGAVPKQSALAEADPTDAAQVTPDRTAELEIESSC